jgi:hypothetical protein
MVKTFPGPFLIDPNVSVALVACDGSLWCIFRSARWAAPAAMWGVVEFDDVRAYCCRPADKEAVKGDPVAPDAWVIEVSGSQFLAETRRNDQQRSVADLGAHRHFIVLDGNHREIDVVARGLSIRSVSTLSVDLAELFSGESRILL